LLAHVNRKLLFQAEEAEKKNPADLNSFTGTFVMIRDDYNPFSDEFVYLVFHNGEIEVPLFCRNMRIIQKAAMMKTEMVVYYEDYILVDIKDLDA
jgi:hypothetical protein